MCRSAAVAGEAAACSCEVSQRLKLSDSDVKHKAAGTFLITLCLVVLREGVMDACRWLRYGEQHRRESGAIGFIF